jgi:hypothetical protein
MELLLWAGAFPFELVAVVAALLCAAQFFL